MSSRKMPITKIIRERRRLFAEKQQAKYDLLTTQQKLDRLPPPPACKRERDKLTARLMEEKGLPREVLSDTSEPLKAKERRSKERKGE